MGLSFLACSDTVGTVPEIPNRFDGSWVDGFARAPQTFAAKVAANREGWISFHQNDWPACVAGGGDPAARAHAELAGFYGRLSTANQEAWQLVDGAWKDRALSHPELVHGLSLAAAGEAGDPAWLSERRAIHDRVLHGQADVSEVVAAASIPVVTERVDGTDRAFFDPWTLQTLAHAESSAAASALPSDPRTFSAVLLGPGGTLNLPPSDTPADRGQAAVHDADQCRDTIRSLDAEIDAWEMQLGGSISPDGRDILDELRLVDATRSRALVQLAETALSQHRPGCALALTQLALDHEAPRAVSPVNSPTLFATMAVAELQLGHSREALDAIEVLVPHYPATIALRETIGTLVVLDGLDRRGESRE